MSNKIKLEVGQKVKTNTGEMEVLSIDKQDVLVRFDDGYEVVAQKGCVIRGSVRNPYFRSYFGVGYRGKGEYKMKGSLAHTKWHNLMTRCYDERYKKNRPTYEEATCCEEWHNFQNFAEWATNQDGFGKHGYELDKDVISYGNKIYSPETCLFIPGAINIFFSNKDVGNAGYIGVNHIKPTSKNCKDGYIARCFIEGERKYLGYYNTPNEAYEVYRRAKIKAAKDLAYEWEGKVDPRVITALLNFKQRLPTL